MRNVLAQPRLRFFYLGNAVSTLGDYALWLALGVWVKELTGSTSLAGINFLMLILGTLLSPVTGTLVDRLPRKPLLIWTNLATAAVLATLIFANDSRQLWLIYLVTFLYGASNTIISSAQQALVQLLVPRDMLADANGLQQTLTQGLRLVTPLLGVGTLALIGAHAVVLLDSATFVVAVICLASISVREAPQRPAKRHWLREMSDGFGYVRRTAVLRQVTLAFGTTMLCLGFSETLGLQVVTIGLHHAPTWLGVMVTVQGIGAVAGGLTAGSVTRRIGDGRLAALGVGLFGMAGLALAAPVTGVVLAASILAGVGLPWFLVGGMTSFQKHTSNELLGRVLGAADLAIQTPQAIGIAAGAALVAVLDYRVICVLMAGTLAVTAIYLVTRREQRTAAPAFAVPVAEAETASQT